MAFITYTALREFEPTGFSKSGSDISAAFADDSFNASSTVLTGLNADEWALVSGFSNSANNGWFQNKANSIAGKILQLTPPITHLRLPGVSGNYASTPDTAANSVVGDFELRAIAALTDWTPATVQSLIGKWTATGNQRSYVLSVNTDGTLNLSWSADGTVVISKNSTVATGIADFAPKWVRGILDVNNGAGGNDVYFYISTDGSVWTQLGATVTTAGVTSVFNGTAALEVGSKTLGTVELMNGRIFNASVLNGIGGSVVASFDPTRGFRNGTTVVAATGETWTINTSGTPPAMLQGRALVTEAAGPSVSIVGYERGPNQSYSLEFYSEKADRSVKVKRSMQQPMGGGAPEILTYRREVFRDVVVLGPLGALLTEAQLLQWREFFASVEGGEAFTYDPYGTVAVPVDPCSAYLASEDYTEERVLTNTPSGSLYKLSFQLRLLT